MHAIGAPAEYTALLEAPGRRYGCTNGGLDVGTFPVSLGAPADCFASSLRMLFPCVDMATTREVDELDATFEVAEPSRAPSIYVHELRLVTFVSVW